MSDQLVLRNARFRVSGHFSDDDYERDHPHVVELAHPPDGFRLVVVEEIMTFHTERGVPIRRGRRQRRPGSAIHAVLLCRPGGGGCLPATLRRRTN